LVSLIGSTWRDRSISAGDSAWNSGLNPLNSTVRSSAGEVRDSGIVLPGARGSVLPISSVSAT
jgi:hypothetical protein